MEKNTTFVVFLLLFTLSLSGCIKGQTQGNADNAETGTQGREWGGRPDFGQPETEPDLMGIVKSITGNEIVLLKIEMPEMSGRNREYTEGAADGETGNRTQRNPASAVVGGFGGGGIIQRGPGGSGAGMRVGGDVDMQAQMIERMKEMSTGEVKVIIPVGIRMLMPEAESEGSPQVVEATLEDIRVDKMIRIWLNKEVADRQVADFVMIMR